MSYLCADRWAAYTSLTVSATATPMANAKLSFPLAVVFNASATTDTSVDNSFTDCLYTWDFGDPSSGTFSYGSRTGISRNSANGPIAGHVYTAAGTYTPTVTVFNGYASKTYTLPSITVTDPATDYATTNTIAVSTGSDFTGAPAGCTQVPNVSDFDAGVVPLIASGKRVLLKAGQTWTSNANGALTGTITDAILGAWGAGARPVVSTTSNIDMLQLNSSNISGLKIQGINFAGDNTATSAAVSVASTIKPNKIHVHDCYVHDLKNGWLAVGNPEDNGDFTDGLVVSESVFDDFGPGLSSYGMLVCCKNAALLGNQFQDAEDGEHTIRFVAAQNMCMQANEVSRGGATRHTLTLRAPVWATAAQYTENVCIYDNKIIGGNPDETVAQKSANSDPVRMRNVVWERNWFVGGASQESAIVIRCYPGPTVIRNNIINATLHDTFSSPIFIESENNQLTTDVSLYNNSLTDTSGTGNVTEVTVWNGGLGGGAPVDTIVTNNIGKVTSSGGTQIFITNLGTNTTQATNSNNTQFVNTNCFTSATPITPASGDFDPANYAVGGGSVVPVYDDFFTTRRSYGNTTPVIDMGAVKS